MRYFLLFPNSVLPRLPICFPMSPSTLLPVVRRLRTECNEFHRPRAVLRDFTISFRPAILLLPRSRRSTPLLPFPIPCLVLCSSGVLLLCRLLPGITPNSLLSRAVV